MDYFYLWAIKLMALLLKSFTNIDGPSLAPFRIFSVVFDTLVGLDL